MDDSSDNKTGPAADRRSASREDALAVVKRLREAGHVAYFAGGCVRDMLLGLDPKDYDVATDATPDRVRKLFTNTQAVGAAFGVILVRHRRSQIEVATFRSDVNYVDGRRPERVVFTTAEEDAKRRDFTINGLFYDPVEEKVIDYVGGQRDLKYKWLRAIGNPDERFAEDHLRLLRAVRFGARFGLTIKGETAMAIASHREQLTRISPERIGQELRLMLTPSTRSRAWDELVRFGMLPVLFRHLPERQDFKLNPSEDKLPIFPELAVGEPVSFGLALAALALCYRSQSSDTPVDLLQPAEVRRTVTACRKAFKISNEEADEVTACLDLSPLLGSGAPNVAVMKRFLAKPFASQARLMLSAVGKAWKPVRARVDALERQSDTFSKQGDFAPAALITGDDLTAAGLTPGPVFKRVLDAVYDAQLEDRVKTKQEAMEVALRLARES